MTASAVFVDDYAAALAGMLERLRHRTLAVGTIGPEGTSGHAAAQLLQRRLADELPGASLGLQFEATFPEVMQAVLDGDVDLALVPSAYKGATTFHWHPRLRMLFHFVAPTPDYGVAARPGGGLPSGRPPTVAVMDEVRGVLDELWPRVQDDVPVVVPARSTSDAAELLANGQVDFALTNDSSRERLDLEWVACRPGVPVVWMLFEATVPVT